jgi:hypothetical protein
MRWLSCNSRTGLSQRLIVLSKFGINHILEQEPSYYKTWSKVDLGLKRMLSLSFAKRVTVSVKLLIFKNYASSLASQGPLCGSLSKIVDTPVNCRQSLFCINSDHQMKTSLSHALLVY